MTVSLYYVQCIVFPFPPWYGEDGRLVTFCGVSGVVPHLLLQLFLHSSHSGGWFGVVIKTHDIFGRWTILDRIVYDDWFSVVL